MERKFTIFALFYFVFEGRFQVQAPRGAYIRRGDLTEGFLRYNFGGLIFGGAYFRNFTVPIQPDVFEQLTSTGSGLFFHFWTIVLPKFVDKLSL